jgi:hypothetical protein
MRRNTLKDLSATISGELDKRWLAEPEGRQSPRVDRIWRADVIVHAEPTSLKVMTLPARRRAVPVRQLHRHLRRRLSGRARNASTWSTTCCRPPEHRIRVKVMTDEDTPVPSLTLFPGAEWFEREAYDCTASCSPAIRTCAAS